jgi:triosephosphate isomerase
MDSNSRNSRRVIVAANWKMHKTIQEALEFIKKISLTNLKTEDNIKIVICPTFICIYPLYSFLSKKKNLKILIGAQDASIAQSGAYTGEVSAFQLKSAGVSFVILGHSERRIHFKEDNLLINRKIKSCLEMGLSVIFCIGERLEEREAGLEEKIVMTQLEEGLRDVDRKAMENIVIAYEPVWAIGTGKNATPQQANSMHLFIRDSIAEIFKDKKLADRISIIYGGSVNKKNIEELIQEPQIDGVLVGGASLDIAEFTEIIKVVKERKGVIN